MAKFESVLQKESRKELRDPARKVERTAKKLTPRRRGRARRALRAKVISTGTRLPKVTIGFDRRAPHARLITGGRRSFILESKRLPSGRLKPFRIGAKLISGRFRIPAKGPRPILEPAIKRHLRDFEQAEVVAAEKALASHFTRRIKRRV